MLEWRELLVHRSIFVDPDRTRPMVNCVQEILYRKDNIGSDTPRDSKEKWSHPDKTNSANAEQSADDRIPEENTGEEQTSTPEDQPEKAIPTTKE